MKTWNHSWSCHHWCIFILPIVAWMQRSCSCYVSRFCRTFTSLCFIRRRAWTWRTSSLVRRRWRISMRKWSSKSLFLSQSLCINYSHKVRGIDYGRSGGGGYYRRRVGGHLGKLVRLLWGAGGGGGHAGGEDCGHDGSERWTWWKMATMWQSWWGSEGRLWPSIYSEALITRNCRGPSNKVWVMKSLSYELCCPFALAMWPP